MSERMIDERDLVRAARRVVETAHAPTAGYQRVHRREIEALAVALATSEPGGEGKQHRCGSCDAPVDDTDFIGHGVVRCQRCCEESVVGMGGPTPAASEGVRERVRQAVEWGIEDAWPRYNRIYDPHDPDDESRQEWVDCITEQVVTALLRTPRGEGVPPPMQWDQATGRDGARYTAGWNACRDAMLTALIRSEAQGEDELAALVVHMWQLKEQRGPLYTESGDFYVDFRRAYQLAAARRDEVQGEGWQITEPARDIVRREMPETRATVREAIRAARRGEGGE